MTQDECKNLDELIATLVKYHPEANVELVEKAYHFAEKAHAGQLRKSGEPYFVHPLTVAGILAKLMLDAPTIAAGLLHDTVEDCDDVTIEVIEQEFGQEVALLVDGVTKLKRLDFTSRVEQQAESIRKMILAMSKDIRVVLIKLADRTHNMRTLKSQPPESQKRIAQETLDIYAPLAHRLGVYKIKQELEDLCLRYLDPEGYQNLIVKVGMKRAEREENIRTVIDTLSDKLKKVYADIDEWRGRPLEQDYPYLFMDGVWHKRCWGGSVENVSILVAVGVGMDGRREVLSVAEGMKEDSESWREFIKGMLARGLKGVRLVTGDRCAGLVAAVNELLPGARYQRCMVHFERNILAKVNPKNRDWAADALKAIFSMESRDKALEKAESVAKDMEARKLREAAKCLREGIGETTTYLLDDASIAAASERTT